MHWTMIFASFLVLEPETLYQVEPVVVTATRIEQPLIQVPRAMDILEGPMIREGEPTLSLKEALALPPGLMVQTRYNPSQGDRITLRGLGSRAPFGVRGIRIFLDEIPLTTPDGTSQLNNVELGVLDRIEVIRGPSSSLYGNAAGGVLTLHTLSRFSTPLRIEPRGIAGAYGLRKWHASVFRGSDRNAYTFSFSQTQSQGFREHSEAQYRNLIALARSTVGKGLLTLVGHYFDAPYLLNPSSLDKATADTAPQTARAFIKRRGTGKQVSQAQGGLTLQYPFSSSFTVKGTLYGVKRSLFNAIPGRIIELNRTSGGFRTVLQYRTGTIQGVGGFDLELQQDARKEFPNLGLPDTLVEVLHGAEIFRNLRKGDAPSLDQDEKVLGFGPFAEVIWSPTPYWTLTLGGRYDRYRFQVVDHLVDGDPDDSGERVMSQFSPLFGVTFRIRPNLALYGNYATAFQTPTLNELSNRPSGEGGMNPELQPERIQNLEVGLKGEISHIGMRFQIVGYRLRIRDMLIPYQLTESEEVFYRNAGQARNLGLEGALQWTPFPGLQIGLSYTAMDFEFEDFQVEWERDETIDTFQLAGNDVPGVPQHRLYAEIRYHSPLGLFGELNIERVSAYYANDFNGPPPGTDKPVEDYINDAYTVVNLRFGLRRRLGLLSVELFGGVNNLFDVRYNSSVVPNAFGDRFFEPAPGRNIYWGLRFPLTLQ